MKKCVYLESGNKTGRIGYLDALRGMAAIGVLFCHWVCSFWPGLYFAESTETAIEHLWRNGPWQIITNGDIGVQFFFVCSGFLIASKVYTSGIGNGFRYLSRKFITCLKVVIPAILFAFLLMRLGWMYHTQVLQIHECFSFLQDYNMFSPTLKSVVEDLSKVLFAGSEYNSPLWTMRFELLGSILVTLISFFISRTVEPGWMRKAAYVLVCIPFLFINYHLCPFVFGALAWDMKHSLKSDKSRLGKLIRYCTESKMLRGLALVIGLYFACINNTPLSGLWSWLRPLQRGSTLIRAAGVTIVLYIIANTRMLQRMLSIKVFSYIGRLSAWVYAFHWPIILSLGCWIYVLLHERVGHYPLIFLILVACLCATIFMSVVYDKFSKITCHLFLKTKNKKK